MDTTNGDETAEHGSLSLMSPSLSDDLLTMRVRSWRSIRIVIIQQMYCSVCFLLAHVEERSRDIFRAASAHQLVTQQCRREGAGEGGRGVSQDTAKFRVLPQNREHCRAVMKN